MPLTKASYSMITGAPVNVLDFGADPTGITDSRAAIQAAIDYGVANNRSIYLPGGTYLINSAGPTFNGKVCGLYFNNFTAGPTLGKHLEMFGDGFYATTITCNSSAPGIDYLIASIGSGQGEGHSDYAVTSSGTASTSVTTNLYLSGGPQNVRNIWSGGAKRGFMGGDNFVACYSEFAAEYGFYFYNQDDSYLVNCSTDGAGIAGIYIQDDVATETYSDETKAFFGISAVNCNFYSAQSETGVGVKINSDRYSYTHHQFTNCIFGNNGFPLGDVNPLAWITAYGAVISSACSVSFTNCKFPLAKYGNIVQGCESVNFTNCVFSKTGFVSTVATTWQCADLSIASSANSVIVMGCVFDTTSGYSFYSQDCKNLTIIGNTFTDVANGGLNSSGVRVNLTNATVGNTAIYITPATTVQTLKIIGNHFDCPTIYNTGKYGIKIDCSVAVPASGRIKISQNTDSGVSFATNYSVTTATAIQQNAWNVINDSIATATPQNFPAVADANAPNSTIYYSTTATKLVWKDASGIVNNLY